MSFYDPLKDERVFNSLQDSNAFKREIRDKYNFFELRAGERFRVVYWPKNIEAGPRKQAQ
jgi:hypothetical protein